MARVQVVRNHKWRLEGVVRFEHIKLSSGAWYYRHPVKDGRCWEHGTAHLSRNQRWCNKKPDIADRMLWEHDLLLKAIEIGRPIYWCEGEKDANKAMEIWGVAATAHHNGRGKAFPGQIKVLAGSSGQINLVMDVDPAGVDIVWTHARLLVKAGVKAEQIRFLRPALVDDHADLTDHIKAHKNLNELVEIGHTDMSQLYQRHVRRVKNKNRRSYGSGGDR
ncbi:MAG TPA: toprim domain-containing protein [Spirillospora sp.]|nr:toprim domain-containing protein [Spirillospora sp.]